MKKTKAKNDDMDIEGLLRKEVYDVIRNYKNEDIEILSKAKIATEIAMSYLKTDKDLHKEDGFGAGLDDEE
jgi:hypothetical protein